MKAKVFLTMITAVLFNAMTGAVFGMALGDGVVVCSSKSQVAVHALHCEVIHGGKVLKRAVGAGVVYEQYLVGLHGLRLQVLHALGEQGATVPVDDDDSNRGGPRICVAVGWRRHLAVAQFLPWSGGAALE